MKICVLTESRPGERRVALTPDIVAKLVGEGWDVTVQAGAGVAANYPDAAYIEAGATLAQGAEAALQGAAVVAKVNAPSADEAALLPSGAIAMSFLQPGQSEEALKVMAARNVTAVSFDLLPRISRAQSMDALSSQATVSGYRAALAAAEHQTKFFPLIMTFTLSNVAAGLVIYWSWNNLLSILQQYVIMRRFKVDNPIDDVIARLTGKPKPSASPG